MTRTYFLPVKLRLQRGGYGGRVPGSVGPMVGRPGGALLPIKSFCYLIDFVWAWDDWEYRSLDDLPGEFTLMDKNGNHDPLRRHEVYYTEKPFGVYISMDGNEEAEMTRLKAHSKLFADQIRTAKCFKNAALYTYNTSFTKTTEYAMPVTQFSEVDWIGLLHLPLKTISPKSLNGS